jgi:hypothetical protein
MGSHKRLLVLGLAYGYKWISLAVFVRSLRTCGYAGDLALFVGETNPRTYLELNRNGVKLIPIRSKYPYHESLAGCPGLNRDHLEKSCPHIQRYAMYRMYLHHLRREYDYVMLADVKDVLFQRNPFDFDAGGAEICFFEENRNRAIRDCPLNSRWISEPFGEATLALIGSNPILCSGTSIGTSGGVFDYCGAMLECMSRHRIVGVGGDQGSHNFLIYTKQIERMRIFPNEDGPVLTLATRTNSPQFNAQGNLVNLRGDVPNTVHQYDRCPRIMKVVNARYLNRGQRLWAWLAYRKAKFLNALRQVAVAQ